MAKGDDILNSGGVSLILDDGMEFDTDDDFLEEDLEEEQEEDPIVEDVEDEEEEQEEKQEEAPKKKSTNKRGKKEETTFETKEDEPEEKVEEEKPSIDYGAVYEELRENDIFINYEVKEGEEFADDKIVEGIEYEIEYGIEQGLKEFNDRTGGMVDYVKAGGTPESWLEMYKETDYSNLDVETLKDNDQLQEQILKEYYERKGFSKAKIERAITRIKDSEKLEEEAFDAAPELVESDKSKKTNKIETQKKQQAELRKKQEETLTQINTQIDSMEYFLPDSKMTKKTKDAIKKKIESRASINKIQKDPVKAEITLALLDHYGLLDGDFSKIMKDAETKATKKTKRSLVNRTSNKGGIVKGADNDGVDASDIMGAFKGRIKK